MGDMLLMLIGVGLLVIAVVFLWGTFIGIGPRRKRNRRLPEWPSDQGFASDEEHQNNNNIEAQEYLDFEPELGPAELLIEDDGPDAGTIEMPIKKRSANQNKKPQQTEFAFDQESDPPSASQTNEPDQTQSQEIIIIKVCSKSDSFFSGADIRQALNSVGMEFGEMNIFHHFGLGQNKQTKPVFSLANMLEPGFFDKDVDKFDQLQTSGLVFFMHTPTQSDEKLAFELMLNTAERLAVFLSGELRDDDHQPLDGRGVESLRRKLMRHD